MKLDLKTKKGKLILFGSIATVAVVATAIAVPVALLVPGKSTATSPYGENTGLSDADLQEIAAFNKANNNALLVTAGTGGEGGSRVTLKEEAFLNRTDLPDGFTLPSSVTDIAANAFKGAKLPKDFTIPSGVVSLDPTAFADVVFDDPYYWNDSAPKAGAKVDVVENNMEWKAFDAKYPGKLVGKSVVNNAFNAKADWTNDFALPSFITKIGADSFSNTTLPAGFKLPESVLVIDGGAFFATVLPVGFTIPSKAIFPNIYHFGNATFPTGFALPDEMKVVGFVSANMEADFNPRSFLQARFAADFTLKDSVTKIAAGTFSSAYLPIGFKIPAGAKIYSFSSVNGWTTTPDKALDPVSLPANSQWSDPKGAVAGSEIVTTTATV